MTGARPDPENTKCVATIIQAVKRPNDDYLILVETTCGRIKDHIISKTCGYLDPLPEGVAHPGWLIRSCYCDEGCYKIDYTPGDELTWVAKDILKDKIEVWDEVPW